MKRSVRACLFILMMPLLALAGVKDTPFLQDYSVQYEIADNTRGAALQKLVVDRNGVAYVLTDRGVARLFEEKVALDQSFRPLFGLPVLDITLYRGDVFYLYHDRMLSNSNAGKYLFHLPRSKYNAFAINENGQALLFGEEGLLLLTLDTGERKELARPAGTRRSRIVPDGNRFLMVLDSTLYAVSAAGAEAVYTHSQDNLTALALDGDRLYVGTTGGYFALDKNSGEVVLPLQTRLPWTEITCFVPSSDGLWVGTRRGAFRKNPDGSVNYYASRRWLRSDYVLDMAPDGEGGMFILSSAGLNRIAFREMTLADKAKHYQRILRQRHIRMGFCGQLRLRVQGDVSTGEIWDSDNDGLWSAMYMAAEAFRYGATGSEDARRNAWETFAALERLETINPLDGFFARSFERIGLKFHERRIWHPTEDREWVWKGTTSSDEFVGHIFGYAVMYEIVAKTKAEKQRIARLTARILDHIIRNGFYLIDIDGKPTQWGRWSPEYLNVIPWTVMDRRLNSVEIIGALQFGYKITGDEKYKKAAYKLLYDYDYLKNIMNSMRNYKYTDHPLGDGWNHSDDELAFLSYWTLYHYAFTDELRQKFAATIKDHWDIEKIEKNPLWNFIYASTGAKEFDLEGALWNLREWPLDLINWRVVNSHRKDLTYLEPNFRNQQSKELLPPDERRLMRWNGNPFELDGGANGYWEAAGEAWLLPYWMGRYLNIIQ